MKNLLILLVIKKKLIIKKINNINISKIINKMIKWNQILEKKNLNITIWIKIIKYKLEIKSIENSIYIINNRVK